MPTDPPASLPRHVKAVARGDRIWLYYRRGSHLWPLPGPVGSAAFLAEYNRIHASYGRLRAETPRGVPGTVDAAVTLYLASADYRRLRTSTQTDYRRVLDAFRGAFGPLHLADLGVAWWEALRDKHHAAPIRWNNLRSRMREVIAMYRRRHPELVPANPLMEVRRLPVPESDQNRAWPEPVLRQVMQAATPQFRALLVGYLLSAQRGGDVTRWTRDQYDAEARTLTMRQGKTGLAMVLHVPETLAQVIEAQPVRHPERLFCSPRGRPWTLANAQETLARLLEQLRLPRHTLHGLRATGPTALIRDGQPTRQARELTGHRSDRNFEIYVRGAGGYEMRRAAQERLDELFRGVIGGAEAEGNARRFSGVTGRAARAGKLATGVETGNSSTGARRRKVAEI